jgi:hypothetical protein
MGPLFHWTRLGATQSREMMWVSIMCRGGRTFQKHRFSSRSIEEQGVSENSKRNALNCAVESRAAQNCSVSRPQCQLCPAILLKSGTIHANQCRKWRFQLVLQSRETTGTGRRMTEIVRDDPIIQTSLSSKGRNCQDRFCGRKRRCPYHKRDSALMGPILQLRRPRNYLMAG